MNFAPILLFVYKRPQHTLQTLKALSENINADKSELYIFSDAAKDEESIAAVSEVRKIIKEKYNFKAVHISEKDSNTGLAESIINGVNEVLNIDNKVIVIEDDLISAPSFINYMNAALDHYEDIENVYSISGYGPSINYPNYPYDSFLIPTRSGSWGWGTWKNVWQNVDWELVDIEKFLTDDIKKKEFNKMGNDMSRILLNQVNRIIDSWSIRFDYHHFLNNAYCVYPVKSKIKNIGMDDSGTHTNYSDYFNVNLDEEIKDNYRFNDIPDERIIQLNRDFYNSNLSFRNKLYQKIKQILKFKN